MMLAQVVVCALLMGFVYSLVSMGLALIWGVMDIINFAHGDFLTMAMFLAFWCCTIWGIDPLLSLPFVALVLFCFGVAVYHVVIRRSLGGTGLSALLATFGLGLFMRNLFLFLWSPNYRAISGALTSGKQLSMMGIAVGLPQLVAAVGSVAATIGLYYLVTKTDLGRAIQATSIDREAAEAVGIDVHKVNAITFGLGSAAVGVAGSLLVNFYYVFPEVGTLFGLLAFMIVALGGFGSILGPAWAGLLVGLVEGLGGYLIAPVFKYVVVFGVYLFVMVFRPKGLFGW